MPLEPAGTGETKAALKQRGNLTGQLAPNHVECAAMLPGVGLLAFTEKEVSNHASNDKGPHPDGGCD